MDQRSFIQHACDVCKSKTVLDYCVFCNVDLCKPCIGEHISDEYDKHKIVPIELCRSSLIYPNCSTHSNKTCELQCQQCNIVICSKCRASKEHKGHDIFVLEECYKRKKHDIRKYIEEIKQVISPTYEEIRNEVDDHISILDEEYDELTAIVSKQGEKWHMEINSFVIKTKNEIIENKVKHRSMLETHLNDIKQIEWQIKESLYTLNELENSNIVSAVIEYRSRNTDFSDLPSKLNVSFPTFCPEVIGIKHIGSLEPATFTSDKNGYKLKKEIETPQIINVLKTGNDQLRSVSFHNEEGVWLSTTDCTIICFNSCGRKINTIATKSGEMPCDITVTCDGDLLYCDWTQKTVNKIANGQIKQIIRLEKWKPSNICAICPRDILIVMRNDENTQSKVVRFSGNEEKQTIQFDENGRPLYSGNHKIKYIAVNKNKNICVADWEAGAIVVVKQNGKLRFRYTGHPLKPNGHPFLPSGITTNSQGHILTADYNNNCIHILAQDGQFLHYIKIVKNPYGLCVDNHDNLMVAEHYTGDVKVIKYLK